MLTTKTKGVLIIHKHHGFANIMPPTSYSWSIKIVSPGVLKTTIITSNDLYTSSDDAETAGKVTALSFNVKIIKVEGL